MYQPDSAPLSSLSFDNRFTRELPADPQPDNHRRQVRWACYSRVQPTPVAKPRLLAWSPEAAALLDLSEADCRSPLFTEVFAGNRLLPGMDPFAMRYGGHQFGSWAGQLGDGRAINLGEVVNRRGERWTLQLKGAGPTPYSRRADGLAVLRSSLREFLCSEAMHHLGVPTTRALSLITTGETVLRDMFYDGNPRQEPGAVVCRLAPSFLRFGNFEILAASDEGDLLRRLLDNSISTDFPHLGPPGEESYQNWFAEICRRTASMVVHWQRVGFVHGVMNTDNMSVLGLTIDYGPYGWLDDYNPDWTPNTTDAEGRRYRYGNQPAIAGWNLLQLGNALYTLTGRAEPLQEALGQYHAAVEEEMQAMLAAKLGLSGPSSEADTALGEELLAILTLAETDMTIFFRRLSRLPDDAQAEEAAGPPAVLADAWYRPEQLDAAYLDRLRRWLAAYRRRLQGDRLPAVERQTRMDRTNPKYVLRNSLAQQAIERAEQGDAGMVEELLDLLRHPYDEQPEREHFFAKRPEWARNRPGCSMLSCSS